MWRKSTVIQQRHGREEDGVIKRQRRETQGRGREKDNKGEREGKNTDYFVIYLWPQKNVMGSVVDSFVLSVSRFISQEQLDGLNLTLCPVVSSPWGPVLQKHLDCSDLVCKSWIKMTPVMILDPVMATGMWHHPIQYAGLSHKHAFLTFGHHLF